MPTPVFQPSPHKEPAKADLRGGMSIPDCALKYSLSEKTVRRYLKEIANEKGGQQQPPDKPGGKTQTEGGKLATVTTPAPAAVVFVLGNQRIEMDPESLYESYLLYQDMKARCELTDGFGIVIRDAMGLMWRVLTTEPLISNGQVIMEVADESGNGSGNKEARVG